jgi:acetyltransferase-like isoleucine patch superfamily enzyme
MIRKILRYLKSASYIRTVYFNFKFLPFNQAIKFPIILGSCVRFDHLTGKVIINGRVRTGMISVGIERFIRDDPHCKTFINIEGTIIFNGTAIFRTGTKISVGRVGLLEFGDNFNLGSDSFLHAKKSIKFGDNVRISWDFQALDTDFHFIKEIKTGKIPPNTKPVIIGDNVWIGNHVTIGKGVILPNGTIVSARSMVNKRFTEENTIIGGIPAKILKQGYVRVFNVEEEKKLNELYESEM